MYLSHFGLRELPFGITPDTSYTFETRAHREAFNTLLIAVKSGEGFIKITGEVGTGKTLLCRRFLTTLSTQCVMAYIPNPNLEPRSLMLALAEELGVVLDQNIDQHRLLKGLSQALLDFAARDLSVVVCLDEAQALPLESLEGLRLLSNLETEKRKLLQVVLFGQPELNQKLAARSVRQLRQRIAFQYEIKGLGRRETGFYVAYRLRVAGHVGPQLFSDRTLRVLHRRSEGIPRLINILAHKALLAAFGEGSPVVTPRHLHAAARDCGEARHWTRRWSPLAWFSAASAAIHTRGILR
jgi:MSHA biogenesis protein MshM